MPSSYANPLCSELNLSDIESAKYGHYIQKHTGFPLPPQAEARQMAEPEDLCHPACTGNSRSPREHPM